MGTCTFLYRVAQKTTWTFAWRTQHSIWNESAEKHVCNEQTSSNMSMNFHLKCFHISRDTSEIVLHVIKQCLQAFYHHRNRFSRKLMVSAGVSMNGKTEIFFTDPQKTKVNLKTYIDFLKTSLLPQCRRLCPDNDFVFGLHARQRSIRPRQSN